MFVMHVCVFTLNFAFFFVYKISTHEKPGCFKNIASVDKVNNKKLDGTAS